MRSTLLALAVLLLASAADGACEYRPIASAPFRSSAMDVAIDGSLLWVASNYGAEVYDRSEDPPVLIGFMALPGATVSVKVLNDVAYVASGSSVFLLRWNGEQITIIDSVDVGATINDLLLAAPFLYAADADGVTQISLEIPLSPAVTNQLLTTSGTAFSLAVKGSDLYAADGDSSVEVYSLNLPSFPQKIGTFTSLAQASSINVNASRIYVSDGIQTQILAGTDTNVVALGTIPGIVTTALDPLTDSVAFIGGGRNIRAVDFHDTTNPAILWSQQIPLSSGTINRVSALADVHDGRIYAAAGDSGILTIDTSSFSSPFPVRDFDTQSSVSVFSFGNTVAAAPASGGLAQFSQTADGVLTSVGTWASGQTWSIEDGRSMRLLTSSGKLMTLWDLVPSPPATLSQASFGSAVASAVLTSTTTAIVVLADHSVRRVDFTTQPAGVTTVQVTGAPNFIVRSDPAIATADLNSDGTMTVHYYPTGDPTATPQSLTLNGSSAGGIALSSDAKVAAATFSGLLIVDFSGSSPVLSVLSSVNPQPAVGLAFSGDTLLVLRTAALEVWDTTSKTMTASFSLDASASGIAVPQGEAIASIATDSGVASVLFSSSSRQPTISSAPSTNRYFRKISGDGRRIALFDGLAAEVIPVGGDGRRLGTTFVPLPRGTIDIAIAGDSTYTVDSNGLVSRLDGNGHTLATFMLNEGSDASPLALFSVGGAVYLSLSKGCLSTGCQQKTDVLDGRSGALLQSVQLDGGLLDFVVEGTKAYALFNLPAEVRILDVSDPYHPVETASAPSSGDPVSIAWSDALSTIFSLGTTLDTYSVPGFTHAVSSQLPVWMPDPSGRVAFPDQRIRVDGDCAVVAGRTFSPQLFSIDQFGNWIPATTPTVPAAGKGIFAMPGVLEILTDFSLETWTTSAPARRHAIE